MSEVDTRPAVPAKMGDFVELRCGVIVGPLNDDAEGSFPIEIANAVMCWRSDGAYRADGSRHDNDIVAIVPRPTPALQQPVERSGGVQMRVGGRYRLRNGEVWTCDHVTCGGAYRISSETDAADSCRSVWVNELGCAYNDGTQDPSDVIAEVTDDATGEPQRVEPPSQPSRYHRQFCGVTIDLYRVANLWGVKSHALFHALKKIMMAGQRGAKDYETDLREAIVAIEEELKISREGGAS